MTPNNCIGRPSFRYSQLVQQAGVLAYDHSRIYLSDIDDNSLAATCQHQSSDRPYKWFV